MSAEGHLGTLQSTPVDVTGARTHLDGLACRRRAIAARCGLFLHALRIMLMRFSDFEHPSFVLGSIIGRYALPQRRLVFRQQLDVPKVAWEDCIRTIYFGRRNYTFPDLAKGLKSLPQLVWSDARRQASNKQPNHSKSLA
jgi:hypothetical protein